MKPTTTIRTALAVPLAGPLLLALGNASFAQTTLWTWDGALPEERFGNGLRGAGDVNADGYDDLIVGSPTDPTMGFAAGSARVYSGLDGTVLHELFGDSGLDLFGSSVAGAGDVDRDGYDDFVVGAPLDLSVGTATVYSGLDGSVLHQFAGANFEDDFGRSVDGAGDVDRDGYPDIVVGASWDKAGNWFGGAVRVYSGADGSLLHEWLGTGVFHFLGRAVSGAGDVNGDGYADVVGGADRASVTATDAGLATVWSGRDGSVLYEWYGDAEQDYFGTAVAGAGDVDGDGFDDVIVGAYANDEGGEDAGLVRVFSGATGSVLYEVVGEAPGDWLGIGVAGAGDVDGDGFSDFLVGISEGNGFQTGTGRTTLYSGQDGTPLLTLDGAAAGDAFGLRVAGAGDVDADGRKDLAVGAPYTDPNGDKSGTVAVHAFDGPFGPWRDLGQGLPGSFEAPVFRGQGDLLGGDPFALDLSGAPPLTLGFLLYGTTAANVPYLGGTIVPDITGPGGYFARLLDAAGGWRLDGVWPTDIPSGVELFFQFWIVDPGVANQTCASNAVVATIP